MNKQKWLIVGLSLAMAATLGVGISACGGEKEPDTPPTPTEHTHTYDAWDYDDTQHWKYCDEHGTDKSNIDETTRANHTFKDGKCECGATEGGEIPDADLDTREFYVVGGGMGTLKNGTWDGPKAGFQFAKAPHKDADGNTVYTFTMELYSADEFKFIEKNAITQETDESGNSKAVWHDELVFTLPDLDVSSVTGAFARASESSDNITVQKGKDGEYEFTIRTTKDGDMKANKVEVRLVKELEPLGVESQYEMYLVGKIASKSTSDWPSMLGVANVPSKCYKMELQDDDETFAIEVELSTADQWKVWNYKVGNVNAGYYPTGMSGNLSTGGGPNGWYRVTWKIGDSDVSIAAHRHTYDVWDFNTTEHWKKCALDNVIDDSSRAAHDFSNGNTCECGYTQEADPDWRINADGTFGAYTGDFVNMTIPANLTTFPKLGKIFGSKMANDDDYVSDRNGWKTVQSVTVAPGSTSFKMEKGALLSMDGKTLYAYFPYNTAEEVTFETVTEVMGGAFAYNDHLKTINLPNAITLNTYVFISTGLEEISIPKVETVRKQCFSGCNLVTVDFESLKTIERTTFVGCANLTSLVFGDKVTNIDGMCINSCKKLSTITIKAVTPPTTTSPCFSSGVSSNLTIYVPDASVDAYKAATGWSTLASKIKPISEAATVAAQEVAMLPGKED